MVTLISAFRSLRTGISSVFRSGFSKITNLFHRIFSRSTPQTPARNLHGRVKNGQGSPLLHKKTDAKSDAAAAKSTTSSQVPFALPPDKKPAASAGKPQAKSAAASVMEASPKVPFPLSPISAATSIAMSKGAGATPSFATHHSPFRVVDQPQDGNCFFHSLRAGLKHLNHSAQSKTHMELRLDMVGLIRETNFSLGATICQEITDLQSKLSDDFENYKIAENFAEEFDQPKDSKALSQSILRQIPSYIPTFFQIGGISVTPLPTTVHETYEKLISGLGELFNLADATSFNDPKFAPVIQSYLETISQPSCFVNILSAEPLANKLNVAIVLHQNSQDYRESARVGPEGRQEVHLVQAGNHFNLLIPN